MTTNVTLPPVGREMPTPWGPVQHGERIAEGLLWVHTAGHGGLMVGLDFARQHLSEAAQRRGQPSGTWLAYEEDCAWAIAAIELEAYWPLLFHHQLETNPEFTPKETCLRSLSLWNADYLIERGLTPLPEEYRQWQVMRKNDEMRAAKDPDLVVSWLRQRDATPDHPALIEAVTADGKAHWVTLESYQQARKGDFFFLSNMLPHQTC